MICILQTVLDSADKLMNDVKARLISKLQAMHTAVQSAGFSVEAVRPKRAPHTVLRGPHFEKLIFFCF